MEKFPSPENRESIIEGLISELAEREGMDPDDIASDVITFAPYEGNDASNPDYLDQVAEMIGISSDEMTVYAVKKAKEHLSEQEGI